MAACASDDAFLPPDRATPASGSTGAAGGSAGASGGTDEEDFSDQLARALSPSGEASSSSARGGGGRAEASRPQDDPALALPVPSRPDWEAEMRRIRELVEDPETSDEEKVKVLHEALKQRIEDAQSHEDGKVVAAKRFDDAAKERERCQAELQRALSSRAKLEGSCRELQQQKSSISRENQRIAEEEQSRHSELKEKFQQAIKDVQEKMDAELEVRQHFLRENEDLRGKLLKFTETYEAQERHVAEQREARTREMEVAQQQLREHETMCAQSKVKTASLEKHNEVLRKSKAVLWDELQGMISKFDEFQEAVAASSQRHGECKTEVDGLQSRLQDLEKENSSLRAGKDLEQLTQEQQVAQKQRDALERLCDNLQKENKKLQEQLLQMPGAKPRG